jgi:ATP-dependent helicase HrpA
MISPLRTLAARAMAVDQRWAEGRFAAVEARAARGQPADRILAEIRERLTPSIVEAERRQALPLTIAYPEHLPVSQRREEIIAALRAHPVLVLTGETGSGKTTQLPKMLLDAGYGRRGLIALTQPRRLAAVAMAARIREECAAPAGLIEHSVRFDDHAGPDTLIRVMTDGLLLAEAAKDRELSRYDAIIIDEAHERSLNIDLLLGLVQLLRRRRPELCVVVASASIEADRFARYFTAPTIAVEGRLYPVEIRYAPPADGDEIGYQQAAIATIRSLVDAGESGDILAFLPTERDIIEAQRKLHELPGTAILPLFSRLTPAEQQRVFQPPAGRLVRKVVLSTNIAETSLTIPGIRFVVDAGLARFKRYQASSRTERLPIEAISQASATQRAGRAGRVSAGVCIRLYSEEDLQARDPYTAPEILRSNLAGVMLTCLGMDLGDPQAFPWLDAPATSAWDQARLLLDELGALTVSEGEVRTPQLSPLGRTLATIPADPQVGRILVAGLTEGCLHEACTIAAFLSVQDPRVRPLGQEAKADAAQKAFQHGGGDLATLLNLWDTWMAAPSTSAKGRLCEELYLGFRRMREWADVRHQLWDALRGIRGFQLPAHGAAAGEWSLERVHRAVLAGMLGNVLMYDPEQRCYRGAGERQLHLHPGSALRGGKAEDSKKAPPMPPWLVACEVVETTRLFARLAAPIDPLWVIDLAGDRVKRRHRDPHWHAGRKQVVCIETTTWKGLPIRDGRLVPYERIDPVAAHRVFISQALVDEDGIHELPVILRNRQVLTLAIGLRHRLRDPTLDAVPEHLAAWYHERLAGVTLSTLDGLRGWLKAHGEGALTLSLADLTSPAIAAKAEAGAPDTVLMGGQQFPLHYRFIPGDSADGVTLELSEAQIPMLDLLRLDWLVPAWSAEVIEAYVAQLPKDARRALIPLAENLPKIVAGVAAFAAHRPFAAALTEVLRSLFGLRIAPLDANGLPPYLRPRFVIRGPDRAVVYEGRDPLFLAAQAGGSDRLRLLKAEWETEPAGTWPGDIPGNGGQVGNLGVGGWVALGRARSADGAIAFRRTVYGSREAALAWHADGIDAGLEAVHGEALAKIALAPASMTLAARWEKLFTTRVGAFRRHAAVAAVLEAERGAIRTAVEWDDLVIRHRAVLATVGSELQTLPERVVVQAESLAQRRRQGTKTLGAAQAALSVALVVDRLLAPGFATRLPWSALRRLDVLLAAQARRLEPASRADARISDRIQGLFSAWDDALGSDAPRLLQVLGLTRTVRGLWGCLHECVAALVEGHAAQAAEMRLRLGLEELARQLGDARDRIAETRQELIEASRMTPRIAVAERRQRLSTELATLIKEFPDLGLGSDLPGQHAQARALIARVRASL